MAYNVIGYALILIWVSFIVYFIAQYFMNKFNNTNTSTTTPNPTTGGGSTTTPSTGMGNKTAGGKIIFYLQKYDGKNFINSVVSYKVASSYTTLQDVTNELAFYTNQLNLPSAPDVETDSGQIVISYPYVARSTSNSITFMWTSDTVYSKLSGLQYDPATNVDNANGIAPQNYCTYDTNAVKAGTWQFTFKDAFTLSNADEG